MVSREHAQAFFQSGVVFVQDLGSSNGTRVNGQTLTGQVPLRPGDTIEIGQSTFRLEADSVVQPTNDVATSRCPRCGGTQIMHLQAATASGTFDTVGHSVNVGAGHVLGGGPNIVTGGVGVSKHHTTSELAKLLAFPFPEPKQTKYVDKAASTAGCLTFLVSSLALSMIFANSERTWLAIVIGLVLGVFVSLAVESGNKSQNSSKKALHDAKENAELMEFQQRRAMYERLYYCGQCFVVFDPLTKRQVPPEQLRSIF